MNSIYNYEDPILYISDYLKSQPSVHHWAKNSGLESSAHVVDILKGKKNLSSKLLTSLVDKIGLDESEYNFFVALVAKKRATTPLEIELYDLFLNELSPKVSQNYLDQRLTDSGVFSHWISTTIMSLSKLKNFELSAENIQNSLRELVPLEIIQAALDRLTELELLTKNTEGQLVCALEGVSTKNNVRSSDAKTYFFQMADVSKSAVDLPLEEREFQSFSIPMSKEKLVLAKDIIRKCRANLAALSGGDPDGVYQANLSFFPLTKNS